MDQQTRCSPMETVLPLFSISQAVGRFEWAVPRMPGAAICMFYVNIDGDLSQVMPQ